MSSYLEVTGLPLRFCEVFFLLFFGDWEIVFFFLFSPRMKDLTKSWSYLTLFDVERSNLQLIEEKAVTEYVLVAKFLTKWALNIEAIAKTFSPIWRARNGFKVQKEGDNALLFTFDNKTEMKKVLAAEPWSFDKHLMVLQ